MVTHHYHEPGGGGWHRTVEGNTLVVAKRWAGEEEKGEQPKTYKHADLTVIQHTALLMMNARREGVTKEEVARTTGKSEELAGFNLMLLRDQHFAAPETDQTYGAAPLWMILRKGEEYLAERDEL